MESRPWTQKIVEEIKKPIVGQDEIMERMLVALLANGHVLLEGMPGLAKTLLVKSLARALGVDFERIQFTPDLLPSDVVGTMIFDPKSSEFRVHHGPIFANLVLADEINRAPAKVQSALLEAMQERQVTIGGNSYLLPAPFFVMATQNPIEQEGTYPLPEAQTDRFLFKLVVTYPEHDEELLMMERWGRLTKQPSVEPVSSGEELLALRSEVDAVYAGQEIQRYILTLVRKTREWARSNAKGPGLFEFGASPRASLSLLQAGKALAWLRGSEFVTPEHVQALALDTLRHRVALTYEAEAQNRTIDSVLLDIIAQTPVPEPVAA
jgi:MoxR-like ATPase